MNVISMAIPQYESISGFVFDRNMVEVLSIYSKNPTITPPVFVRVEKEQMEGRTGFYASFVTVLTCADRERLNILMGDFITSDEEYMAEKLAANVMQKIKL